MYQTVTERRPMPSADVQVSFNGDASGLQAALAAAQTSVAQVQAAFADTGAISSWAAAMAAGASAGAQAVSAAASVIQDGLTTRLDPIGKSVDQLFLGLLNGSETFGEAFEKMGEQMLARFLGWTVQMGAQWALNELTQTAATTTGAATRAAVQLAADAQGMAASGEQALSDIGNSAARAAAGAFAAVASTPVVGPALAPEAAAEALAAALAFGGSVVSAAGGWGQVPYDGALASLHKDEMVLPASIASPLRASVGGLGQGAPASTSGGGDTHHHWTINALDAQSFTRMLRANPDAVTGALGAAAQRLTLTPGRLQGGMAAR
jgi:hypothetical protein